MLDCGGRGRSRRLSAGGFVFALALAGCGGGDDGLAELRDEAAGVLADLGADVQREPQVQRSKGVEYVAADGTVGGERRDIVERVAAALAAGGWETGPATAVEAPAGGPVGMRLIGRRADLAVQVLVTGTLGTAQAPPGRQWVQLAVAHVDDRLEWTRAAD